MSEKKLENLLSAPAGALSGLVERAREMQTLTECVRRALPSETRPHLVSAAYRETGTLVLIADSSAWASRLRFTSAEAVEAARELGLDAESCRVLVRPRD